MDLWAALSRHTGRARIHPKDGEVRTEKTFGRHQMATRCIWCVALQGRRMFESELAQFEMGRKNVATSHDPHKPAVLHHGQPVDARADHSADRLDGGCRGVDGLGG